VSTVGIFVIV